MKFANPASRYALVGVFVADTGKGVRVAVTGAGQSGVFRVPAMEPALAKNFSPAAVAGIKVSPDDLNPDNHPRPQSRTHLVTVMHKGPAPATGQYDPPPPEQERARTAGDP